MKLDISFFYVDYLVKNLVIKKTYQFDAEKKKSMTLIPPRELPDSLRQNPISVAVK